MISSTPSLDPLLSPEWSRPEQQQQLEWLGGGTLAMFLVCLNGLADRGRGIPGQRDADETATNVSVT
jgi:hypothetical protein